jgi:AcrR family transcriptional regulator
VTRRRAETRSRLLDAAFVVFAKNGFGRTSIEEVCDEAGYTRGAFYSNFDTLDELFYALYLQRAEIIASQVSVAAASASTDLRSVMSSIIEALMVDRDWVLVKTDFLLHAARHPEVAEELRSYRRQLQKALAATLKVSVEFSRLPESLRSPDRLARAIITIHDGAMEQLLLYPNVGELRTWLAELNNALLGSGGLGD